MTDEAEQRPQSVKVINWKPLLEYAVLAPSSHNTQPWRFALSGDMIHLRADRTRALTANDPEDRELTISCACALMNLRIAAAHEQFSYTTHLLPDAEDEDLLAVMKIGTDGAVRSDEADLLEQIPSRRTHRKRFDEKTVPDDILAQLSRAAQKEGAWLEFATSAEKRVEMANLVARGDSIQWADPGWRRELAAWIHSKREKDGLTVPGPVTPLAQIIVRTFDMGSRVGAKDRQLAEESPVLAVLGTRQDDTAAWLQAGQALEHVLLTAQRAGFQASYLNQPIQVASLRPHLQKMLAKPGVPLILMRLGYPDEDSAVTPRREVDDVLEPV